MCWTYMGPDVVQSTYLSQRASRTPPWYRQRGHRRDVGQCLTYLSCSACAGRQMFAEVVQPLLCHFIQGFNTTVSL